MQVYFFPPCVLAYLINPIRTLSEPHMNSIWTLGIDAGATFLQCVTGPRTCTTGIFLHKRFSNLPLELVGALHSNLEEDLGWSQQVIFTRH